MNRLPDAEFSVMKGLWECETPVSTADLRRHLEEKRNWNMSALQVVLSRLEEKGFVRSEKQGKNRFYTVLISEKEYISGESGTFFDRFGKSGVTDLIAGLYKNNNITKDDLTELMEFIREHTDEKG